MTTKLTKASKPHKHSWKVTLDSKPVSETDYHLMFIECDCGIKITVKEFKDDTHILDDTEE